MSTGGIRHDNTSILSYTFGVPCVSWSTILCGTYAEGAVMLEGAVTAMAMPALMLFVTSDAGQLIQSIL